MKQLYSTDDRKYIIANYGIVPYKDMAKKLGRTTASVKSFTSRFGLTKVSVGKSKFSRKPRTFSCDDNYFEKKSLESIYWAGFIAADGYIRENPRQSKRLCVMLQLRDINHLEKLKEAISFTGGINQGYSKYEYNGVISQKGYCSIAIASNTACDDLQKLYNITPRKSLTYTPPEWLNREQFFWFVKGVVDGDGSIGRKLHKSYDFKFSLLGTHSLLTFIRDRFREYFGINFSEKSLSKNRNIWVLNITHTNGRVVMGELAKIDYGLGRKWEGILDLCENYHDPRHVLTDVDIQEIRDRLILNHKQADIAKDFGVHQVTVSQIKLGKGRFKVIEGMIEVEDEETIN